MGFQPANDGCCCVLAGLFVVKKIIFNDQWNCFDTKIIHQDYACPENTKKAILLIPWDPGWTWKQIRWWWKAPHYQVAPANTTQWRRGGVCLKLRSNVKPKHIPRWYRNICGFRTGWIIWADACPASIFPSPQPELTTCSQLPPFNYSRRMGQGKGQYKSGPGLTDGTHRIHLNLY